MLEFHMENIKNAAIRTEKKYDPSHAGLRITPPFRRR
jgi:hypothetical protein